MSYSMADGMQVAAQATADITTWLRGRPETISVQNVEHEPEFQIRDIDLIWTTQKSEILVEIKGDRWEKTGNFFFETRSNFEKGTPGCFMYTEASWLFYYFVTPRILYMLPMPMTRDWFAANINRFRERSTTTPVGDGHYTTVGRLVPIQAVLQEVSGVVKQQLQG